jgi:hypothetical protein
VAELLREESWWVKSESCWALPLAFFIIEELINGSAHSWLSFSWTSTFWLEVLLSVPSAETLSTSALTLLLRFSTGFILRDILRQSGNLAELASWDKFRSS